MKKYPLRLNMFWKTFIITTVMLLGITLIAFILIYQLLPGFYQTHKIDTYTELVENRLSELEQAVTLESEIEVLTDILLNSHTFFALRDHTGHVLFQTSAEFGTTHTVRVDDGYDTNGLTFQGITYSEVDDPLIFNQSFGEFHGIESSSQVEFIRGPSSVFAFNFNPIRFEYTFLNIDFNYENSADELRHLELAIPLSPLADAQTVIMSMYPFAIALSIFFALIFALALSRWIASPIKQIQAATSKMSKLEPNVAIATKSHDEIGILSQDISQLYEQLRGTIVTLEQEVSRYSDAENKKIEFLQSVSHEMKTPLASANALLEGIIYEVSPYHDNPKQYLTECRDFLQKTIQLTKESLNLSEQYKKPENLYDLADIIKETSNLYGVIFMVKQLSYHEDVPGNIMIHTKKHLLSKVLSNLFSNAANYTSVGGQVRVDFNDGVLTVFNSCKPLSQEQVDEIFKPLMTQNTADHATGLGLFIVKQLLRQLKIKFTFVASADGTGMEFKLYLHPKE